MAINLYLGDCMEAMKSMKENQYDLAIVDPPYGIDRNNMNMGNSVFNKDSKNWDKNTPDKRYFDSLFSVSNNQIIWGGNYFDIPPSQYFCIWDKGETMYNRDFAECEFAWVSSGGTRIYKKSPNQPERIHPTQKPVKLYEWLLMNYAKPNQKILDTHGGSMSIALAVHNVNEREGMNLSLDIWEIDEEYYNAGVKRYNGHISQKTIFS